MLSVYGKAVAVMCSV